MFYHQAGVTTLVASKYVLSPRAVQIRKMMISKRLSLNHDFICGIDNL